MRVYDVTHLGDGELIQDLKAHVAKERDATAHLLARIAEVDARRLHVPAGYPSMFEYCVRELGFSEDAAYKRIQAARSARRFPGLLDAVARGRLHLTGVVLIAPHLTRANAADLISASAGKRKTEIQELLAARFPKPDVPTVLRALPTRGARQLAPAQVETPAASAAHARQLVPEPVSVDRSPAAQLVPEPVAAPRPRVTPLAPRRFALQTTIGESTHQKLQYARELLSHQLPSGDLGQVLDLALDELIRKLEKRKFAATNKPRKARQRQTNKRAISAHVKREVWKRDKGRCTFVGKSGRRCDARSFLEFDHIEPVARGGWATTGNLRLRCRSHNQYEAECAFGAGFMHDKRAAPGGASRTAQSAGAPTAGGGRKGPPAVTRGHQGSESLPSAPNPAPSAPSGPQHQGPSMRRIGP